MIIIPSLRFETELFERVVVAAVGCGLVGGWRLEHNNWTTNNSTLPERAVHNILINSSGSCCMCVYCSLKYLFDVEKMTDMPAISSTIEDDTNIVSSNNDIAAVEDKGAENNIPSNEEEDGYDYDVIICGTDLIQSILSSALSRAGKKVLHCDGNEWYGGFDAVLYGGSTLDSFIEGCEELQKDKDDDGDTKNSEEVKMKTDASSIQLLPRGKYGHLRLHSQTFISTNKEEEVSPELKGDEEIVSTELKPEEDTTSKDIDQLCIKDDPTETKEETLDENSFESSTDANNNETEATSIQHPTVNPLEHGFCFDITPSLLYASGIAVEGLVKSGVADYLEFKSLKGLYLLMEEEKPSASRGGRRTRNTGKGRTSKDKVVPNEDGGSANEGKLACYRVPCSKGDVFRSKLLSPVDKRRLMKFLQLITDYGMASQLGEGGESSNTESGETYADEQSNKEGGNDTTDEPGNTTTENAEAVAGEDAVQSINERHLHRGRALSRPQNKAMPSSSEMDSLMRCVRDNVSFLDFLTNVAKLPERLATVVIYALALAPFGQSVPAENAEIQGAVARVNQYSTKDGVDDLVRHVTALGRFGDTAFLVPMYGSGELSQAFCRSGAVYGSTYMLRRSPVAVSIDADLGVKGVMLSGEEHIGGNDDLNTEDVSDREISCKHVIVPSTMMIQSNIRSNTTKARVYRRISILEGKLMIGQDQDGSDAEQRYAIVIPPGTPGLENKTAIHGVAIDDSAFVTPARKNYTMLHLTTSGQPGDGIQEDALYLDVISKAVQYLIASQPRNGEDTSVKECHHVAFSYTASDIMSSLNDTGHPNRTPGLHVCYKDGQSLTCDSAFTEAKRIFDEICPDSDFLALAQKVEDAIVYRDEHESDDEKMVLESACDMIQAPAKVDEEVQPPSEDGTGENCNDDS